MMASQETARSRAKRAQIQRGATRVFLAGGFAGATTDAIAKAAGVSKQTLYVYYRTKEQLMVDVLDTLLSRLNRDHAVLDAERPTGSLPELRETLTTLACEVLQALTDSDYLALARVIIADSPQVPEIGRLWAQTITGGVRPIVAELLERARDHEVIGAVDVEAATRMFVGGVLTYILPDGIVATAGKPVAAPPRERVERLVDLFLRAVSTD
ncbi:TetR/AcrR family transcriptional regulator [Nonomuraea sp. KC401]|uniref:TetR/AcrR family transcriptional regulator n=1 Tax=unclassified Nonomuraea TaxID=2593643 RepID=UPI0010FCEB08|nr:MULTISPECIES: TetR/AcrR family transcriptional regulator [unclassified Nonomuraea]TLF59018.1 TetR/AcrR family transcriptional regulator [Nonomuraea sp. KC401]